MYRPLNCIALRTVRYSDRNSILSVYTLQQGRMSLLVPAGTGKAAARLRALLMPLGRFDCVADIRTATDATSTPSAMCAPWSFPRRPILCGPPSPCLSPIC